MMLPAPRTDETVTKRTQMMQALSDMWRGALDPIVRGGSCGCCSAPGVVLRADWLELDILDYLETSYSKVADAVLLDALNQRRAGDPVSFLTWLSRLEDAGFAADDARRLRSDIATILSRMAHRHAHGES